MSLLQPIEFTAEKIPANYPRTFNHIGDHIRAKRLNLGVQVQEAAKMIGVHPVTLRNWEHKYIEEPAIKHWPGIIRFLGYCSYHPCPTLPKKVTMWRKLKGISMENLAKQLQVDERSITKFESGERLSKGFQARLGKKLLALLEDADVSDEWSGPPMAMIICNN